MSFRSRPTLLRPALLADAVVSGATGLLLAAGAPLLAPWLGLPTELLRGAGLCLLPFVAFVALVARSAPVRPGQVRAVVALNALWVVASVALLLLGPASLTGLGVLCVSAQALVVALFAEFQWMGLRGATA